MKQLILSNRARLVFLHDIVMTVLSVPAALVLRMGSDMMSIAQQEILFACIILMLIAIPVYAGFGMYKGIWRFASLEDMVIVGKAVSMTSLIFLLVMFFASRLEWLPRSFPIINWLLLMIVLGGSRAAYRISRDRKTSHLLKASSPDRIAVLLVGTGPETDLFLRELRNAQAPVYNVVGLLAFDGRRVGLHIRNTPIVGTVEDLDRTLVKSLPIQPRKLIITKQDPPAESLRKLVEITQELGLTVSRSSRLSELKEGAEDHLTDNIRPIAIEDLLGRPQASLDRPAMKDLVHGKRVLVTGAGGSIGSELVRQITAQGPAEITLLDVSEYLLYLIDHEVAKTWPDMPRHTVLANICEEARINDIFSRLKPELVFHAAALKHVPMMENNPLEAVLTNLGGSRIIADACRRAGILCMVQISTDKAVNPTNVMGGTKHLAECYIQALDPISRAEGSTKFVVVRFGNVLGSSGSVVPLFQRQLAEGGPLTVTHPEIKRFFMTIREAVELVLQASVLGVKDATSAGKIYVLEMGQAVKIADLARQIIILAGKRPDIDIKIAYTGLRAGEKLYEEILHDDESRMSTSVDGILLAAPRGHEYKQLVKELDAILKAAKSHNRQQTLARLQKLIPEYTGDQHTLDSDGTITRSSHSA